MIRLLALFAVLGAATGAAQQLQITTKGWCSPVFVNVAGPVTVKCNGVDPQAMDALNRQLAAQKLGERAALQEANEWAGRYNAIKKELAEVDDTESARKAEEDLREGKLDEAAALLTQIADNQDERNVERAALHNYEGGLALELDFETQKALTYLERAQRFVPDNPKYSIEYARALLKENHLAEAKAVYERVLPQLVQLKDQDIKYRPLDMDASVDAGMLYETLGDIQQARDSYNNAFTECLVLGLMPTPQCDATMLSGILSQLGTILLRQQDYKSAEAIYSMAYQRYQAASKDSSAYLREETTLLSYLGYVYELEGRTDDAEHALKIALSEQQLLLDRTNPDVVDATAQTELLLASVKSDESKPEEAEVYFKKAADDFRSLVQQDADAYTPHLERTLYVWGRSDLVADRDEQADAVYQELLPIVEKLATASPSVYREDLASTYSALAQIRSGANQYAEAVPFLKQCIEVDRKMDPTPDNLESLAKSLTALSFDALVAQNLELAQSSADEAEKILRGLYAQNPTRHADELGQALVMQAMLIKGITKDCNAMMAKLNEATQVSSAQAVVQLAGVLQSSCKAHSP